MIIHTLNSLKSWASKNKKIMDYQTFMRRAVIKTDSVSSISVVELEVPAYLQPVIDKYATECNNTDYEIQDPKLNINNAFSKFCIKIMQLRSSYELYLNKDTPYELHLLGYCKQKIKYWKREESHDVPDKPIYVLTDFLAEYAEKMKDLQEIYQLSQQNAAKAEKISNINVLNLENDPIVKQFIQDEFVFDHYINQPNTLLLRYNPTLNTGVRYWSRFQIKLSPEREKAKEQLRALLPYKNYLKFTNYTKDLAQYPEFNGTLSLPGSPEPYYDVRKGDGQSTHFLTKVKKSDEMTDYIEKELSEELKVNKLNNKFLINRVRKSYRYVIGICNQLLLKVNFKTKEEFRAQLPAVMEVVKFWNQLPDIEFV